MSKYSAIKHLTKEDVVKNGSIFTPKSITKLVWEKCKDLLTEDMIILDMGSGYGAFISEFTSKVPNTVIGTEYDEFSYNFLVQEFPGATFFHDNSLLDISREKYGILTQQPLLIVGNPPYNDITSQYKKGEKGNVECDEDVRSRDFGMSFLKAYNKLSPEYICVLHPFAYLIKKQNFNSLGSFSKNYKLINATVFSSKEFETIMRTNSDFPVVAALYRRDKNGMDYDYIREFKFRIFRTRKNFVLSEIKTIDGIISKYPSKTKQEKLQFYTLRDMNALFRNAAFVGPTVKNGVDVSITTLYQYAWLFFLKENFSPKKYAFIYGNLSPLYSDKIESDEIKRMLVSYAYDKSVFVKQAFTSSQIQLHYGEMLTEYQPLYDILNSLYI